MEKDLLIKTLNETSDIKEIKSLISDLHPRDLAILLLELEDEAQDKVISCLSSEELAEILSFADSDDSSELLEDVPVKKVAEIIEEMEIDDASDILDEMDKQLVSKIKKLLDKETLSDIEEVSKYEEGTAGSIMNPNFIKFNDSMSVKDAFKSVTLQAPEAEVIDPLFVVNDKDELLGVVDLKELICARMPKTVNDVMLTNYQSIDCLGSVEDASKIVRDYDLKALPVLKDKRIVGIITMDDAFDAFTDSAEEDYAKFAGLTEDEEDDETIFSSIKKRIPWLAILLILDVVVALVISKFDDVIAHLTILTFFQTAVLNLSGNCGTQSLAVTVRELANSNDTKGIFKQIGKEALQGLLLGALISIVSFCFVVTMLVIKNSLGDTLEIGFIHQVGIVLGLSVLISVSAANIVGSLIPLIFYKLKIDPAVASGPFITTIIDIVSVLIYFGTALIVLSNYL